MNEYSEKSSADILHILLWVTGILSFVLGFVLGVCSLKKLNKLRNKHNNESFDADEYIRSLNLE